ncbi:MAG: ABC transporter ATP-binding protein [Acidimicrobiales bacterium]
MSAPAAARGLPIEIRGLTKNFGRVHAVAGLDFTVQPGRVTGFLGPNGAGKTTTLRMLLGLVSPTSGSATIAGRRYRELHDPLRHVGAVLEATSFHPSRRARSHLKMIALAGGIDFSRIDAVLELVGLSGDAKRKVGGFSMGMRQRLELAGALLGDPEVLILDEPSNGLDPQGIAWLREFLRHLAREGRTVLVSSHLLAEMAQTVDDVVIVAQGQLRAQGPLASLVANTTRSAMRVRTPEGDRLQALVHSAGVRSRREAADVVVVEGVTPEYLGPILARYQIVTYELTSEGTNLEELFLSLTAGLGYGATVPPDAAGGPAVAPTPGGSTGVPRHAAPGPPQPAPPPTAPPQPAPPQPAPAQPPAQPPAQAPPAQAPPVQPGPGQPPSPQPPAGGGAP